MNSRVRLFRIPEYVALVKEHCVPLVLDERLYREVKDREAVFNAGAGSCTGTWCHLMSPSGKLVAVMVREDPVAVLRRGLEAYARLPESDRKPPASFMDDLETRSRVGRRHIPEPPTNALVLKTFISHLERHPRDEIVRAKKPYLEDVTRDTLWLTEAEGKSMVPTDPKKGDRHDVAPSIRERVARFCLWDCYRSGFAARAWRREDIRSNEMKLTVEEVTADRLRMSLHGRVLIASDANIAKSKLGSDATLQGYLDYDRRKQRFTRIDVASLADAWWFEPLNITGQFAAMNERVGRIVMGVAFELAPPDTAFYRVPPRFLGHGKVYFGEKP